VAVWHLSIALAASVLLAGATPRQSPAEATNSSARAQGTESAPADWRAATREDIAEAYRIFSRHHPGMFDPNNPGFPAQLRRARDAALAFAEKADDSEGHMRALGVFSAGLADGHAHIVAAYNGQSDLLWPGFRTVWRGESLHVLTGSDGGPPRGSVLLGCGGKDARRLIRKQAFSFLGGRPAEAGQWWINAPFFFWRMQSPYEALPRDCEFRRPDGRSADYQLEWRPVPKEVVDRWGEEMRRQPIGLTEPRRGIYWVTLSTFSPDEQGRARYDRLFEALDDNAHGIASARAIVIDLRNNNGGSSSWGEEVAGRLWGKAAVDAAMARYFRQTQIWWLADSENVAHFREAAMRFRSEKRLEVADRLDEVASNLALALKRGKRFWVEDFGASLAAKATAATPRRLPPIYVITDGGCASACLDAVDVFTRFSGVKLMGAPTSADSQYLDVRLEPLPSGRAAVWLPTKIWVHRPRRAGEVYRPDIPVNDLDWTTATMLDHIEGDLAAR
jgi:hypothetical protein